jgi:LacI family transcriptional regulator
VNYSANKIRLKDIANLAGVSIGTVDRVIHNRGEVAEKTKARIEKILKETDYSPNLMARVLKSKKHIHIVSLLPEPTDTNLYWKNHPTGITRAFEELEPFSVSLTQVTFNMQSEQDYQQKTREVMKLNPDGVLLAPIFKSESQQFCLQMESENIPYVFIDGYIENANFLAYIGEDIFRSGRVAGQLTDIITPDGKDILAINIARNIKNVHHLEKRTRGFLDYLSTSGLNTGKKLSISIPGTSPEIIKSEMDRVFHQNPGIGSVFVSGSKSYLIAGYIEDAGFKSVGVIGYDLLERNVHYLKSGITSFLIGQRPEEQSYKGIKKLFDYLSLNRKPDKMEYLPVDIVTSENVDFFIKQPKMSF